VSSSISRAIVAGQVPKGARITVDIKEGELAVESGLGRREARSEGAVEGGDLESQLP